MQKKRGTKGFTLAELLIVVAIIGVLSGVAFIAVQKHEKSMTQLEYDAIAKEIFVAAQNHLTLAKSQNYLNLPETGYGTQPSGENRAVADDTNTDIYYLTSDAILSVGPTLLDQMLPFGSIDESIRSGNYLIRYQPKAAVVLDVFYWGNGGKYDTGSATSYVHLMNDLSGTDKKSSRESNQPMIGWFGGSEVAETGAYLNAPLVEVINAERLLVRVTDTNVNDSNITSQKPRLKLIVEGETSNAKMAISLTGDSASGSIPLNKPMAGVASRLCDVTGETEVTYDIVLDDITQAGMHFAQLKEDDEFIKNDTSLPNDKYTWIDEFIPGENITIQAVAYSNEYLTNIAYSGIWKTNSLFAEVTTTPVINAVNKADEVHITNIRHLENLDDDISGVEYNGSFFNNSIKAVQMSDLKWTDFTSAVGESFGICLLDGKSTNAGCYMPVTPSYTLSYDGQSVVTTMTKNGELTTATEEKVLHSITGIKVDNAGSSENNVSITAGGMFGTLVVGSSVSNLELVDFSVSLASTTDPGNAGALAGTITDTTVTNVVAHNSSGITGETDNRKISASGAVGGLIGMMKQNSGKTCKVEKSAAALIVSSTGGNAGGLIGTADGGTVSACYSGGHTVDKKDEDDNIIGILYDKDNYNITTSNGIAGGLIGDAGATEVKYSYSTCSVKGTAAAGGLLGKSTAVKEKVENCYATGLVYESKSAEAKEGALVGILTNEDALKNCKYFEIINEREDETNGGFKYLAPIGSNTSFSNSEGTVIAFDESADKYNAFVDEPLKWTPSVTYDGKSNDDDKDDWLDIYYGKKYNLQNIKRLGGEILDEPKTETTANGTVTTPADFVATHYGDWPAPEIFVVNEQG